MNIDIQVSGLAPSGSFGVHIRQFGDLTGPNFSHTGSFFGQGICPRESIIGNIKSDASGNANVTVTNQLITVDMILGRSLVIQQNSAACTPQSSSPPVAMAAGVVGRIRGQTIPIPTPPKPKSTDIGKPKPGSGKDGQAQSKAGVPGSAATQSTSASLTLSLLAIAYFGIFH